jgi:hypothetical protein
MSKVFALTASGFDSKGELPASLIPRRWRRNPWTRSRILSGPKRSVSGVEFTMSQNNTLTCFISPGRVPTGVRIGAIRGSGEAEAFRPGLERGAPHCPQNLFSGGLAAPHDRQPAPSGAPHCPQTLAPAGFSAWHREHLIRVLYSVAALL